MLLWQNINCLPAYLKKTVRLLKLFSIYVTLAENQLFICWHLCVHLAASLVT
jgi:hypothetical protein